MTTKKSNPDKGLRTVDINFAGEKRTLKFTHSTIGDFEADANVVLRAMGVLSGSQMIFAEGIISGWLETARIFSFALYHGLGKTLEVPEIDDGIDAHVQAGGSKQDLIRDIKRAFRMATDPSSLASLERSWKAYDQRMAHLTEIENRKMDAIEKALHEVKEVLTPGSPTNA
jgi:hypothetical protein